MLSSTKRYLQFVKPYKWKIIFTILIGIVKFAIPLLIPLILGYVVDHVVNADLSTADKVNRLLWLLGSALIVFLISTVRRLSTIVNIWRNGQETGCSMISGISCLITFSA